MRTEDKIAMKIPLVNLKHIHEIVKSDLLREFNHSIETSGFIGGRNVEEFETEFAGYCQVKYSTGVGNGTDALYLALRALGIGHGDEVIIPSHTFIATAEAVSMAGANPVFVDIDIETYCMDPSLLEAKISANTRAIIPVHLYGHPAEMDSIRAVARKYNLKVVEDACQAHGAEYKGGRVGSLGDMACFSFYPGKNLGALGDGGAVVSSDGDLIHKVKRISDHGRNGKYHHGVVGVNSRLDGMQAAFLRVKLKRLDAWNGERIRVAEIFRIYLKDIDELVLPICSPEVKHVYHLYVVLVESRDELHDYLNANGIFSGIHYPEPIHLQEAYRHLNIAKGTLPHTERVAKQCLSLPIYPGMNEEEIKYIAQKIKTFYARGE